MLRRVVVCMSIAMFCAATARGQTPRLPNPDSSGLPPASTVIRLPSDPPPSASPALPAADDKSGPHAPGAAAKSRAATPAAAAAPAVPTAAPEPWAKRSAGRLFARRLASAAANDANLAGRHPRTDVGVWTSDPRYSQPVVDEFGLRYDIETGKGINDWYFKLPRPFGANTTFYMQWQQRFNAAFVDTVFRMRGGGFPGIKLAMISEFTGSSTWPKLVVSTLDQHKFPFLYQYDQGGNTSNLMAGANNGADYDWQPKVGVPASCVYTVNNRTPQGQPTPGCESIVADKWITFDLVVDTGGEIPGTKTWECDRKLYMTIDGVKRLVVHYSSTNRPPGRNARPWTAVWLSPYMTDRDPAQTFPVTPSVWYREVIVDDKPIPPPA